MTKDFSQYQYLIDQFKGKVTASDFESKYNAATKQLPKSEKFLLKMELKRLATPCTRLIDLRGLVDGECQEFEDDGRLHFLDELAIAVYKDNLKHYGSYTFGVYEAVNNTENNYRVIYQKEKSGAGDKKSSESVEKSTLEKSSYPANIVQFGQYFNRKEERMNYAIALQFFVKDGPVIEAASSDLSVSGCKIRLKKPLEIGIGQELVVRFLGLEKEFEFGAITEFLYIVRNINFLDGDQFIGIERVTQGEPDAYMNFLKGYIQGNKRRYKINLDNTLNAVETRGYEQFALPKSNELAVFISSEFAEKRPVYGLTSANSHEAFYYWQDERRKPTIASLLNAERLERLIDTNAGEPLLVFCLKHKSKNKIFFYTMDSIQLSKEDDIFVQQLLGFAASKESFAIFQLKAMAIDYELCDSPLTLAGSLEKKDAYLDLPPSEDVLQLLKPLTHIVTVEDVTSEIAKNEYKLLSYANIDPQRIKQYGHKWQENPIVVDEVKINYKNQRQEPRFKYNSKVVLETGVGRQIVAKTLDFSTLGISVLLKEPTLLTKGDVLKVSFPELQKITSKFDLNRLPYEVMRLNEQKTVLNLRVVVRQHQHMGRAFFKLLIEKNKEKLTPDEYALLVPGLAKALRNVYGHFTRATSVFVQTSGSRYKFEKIGSSGVYGRLNELMAQYASEGAQFNLYPLFSNAQMYDKITAALKQMITTDKPEVIELYLRFNSNKKSVDDVFVSKTIDELTSQEHRSVFINKANSRGELLVIRMTLSRAGTPDMEQLNPELSYIGAYAIHRAKSIEQDLWSVVGVIQLTDVTKEVLFRHQLFN